MIAFSSVIAHFSYWYNWLSHPTNKILSCTLWSNILPLFSIISSTFPCNACKCHKSHKLPFYTSSFYSYAPLELIYLNVWTSPIESYYGFKYYVLFVDHFRKYIWLYPFKQKSEVSNVFSRFKALVENLFIHFIISLFSNNGGEHQALKLFLTLHGISHITTPHHTP